MSYAEVAVNSPLAQPRTFCYAIPPDMSLSLGHAVWVPFGPRMVQGVVFALSEQPSVEETREIAELIDPLPLLSPHQIMLARWLSEHYLCPLFDCVALMLPPGFERRMRTFIQAVANPLQETLNSLNPKQRGLLYLVHKKGRIELGELKKKLGRVEPIVEQLVRKGLVTKSRELERARVSPKTVPYIRLAIEPEQAEEEIKALEKRRAYRQAMLLCSLVAETAPIPLSQVEHLGFSGSVVQALKEKGLIATERHRVQRDPLAHRTFERATLPQLTPAQRQAYLQIEENIEEAASGNHRNGKPPVFLLHGVTGSGKTEIYLRALEKAISLEKRAIVMVPEIALTPQTISRFSARFPGRVAVLHSKLSIGEQFDEWQRIRDGDFDVVIGSRGAIFAPQPNLGLIVLDEEHEWTYKQQEQSPRYHARDVAIRLAELSGSVVILGSSTPDVGSYYRAQRGDFQLLELPERIMGPSLPQVEVVDMRQELKQGNRSIFSRSLKKATEEALAGDEQVILFLNRRGTASFIQCRDCGFVLRCRRCDVPLTYHGTQDSVVCHQCNYRMPSPDICPNCLSKRIKFLGIGTQRVEEEAIKAFPNAETLRWDRDVTKGKHSHEEILDNFLAHKANTLIGTQMLAKGLEMPLVTLVGVINADIGLYLPDFRSSEHTFQLLTQVAGRAGRGASRGKVIIQTYTPEHYAIAAAANHDYLAFYEQELAFRREQRLPPFNRLACLTHTHTNAEACQSEAERMKRLLQSEIDSWGFADTSLIGPAPAYIQRIRGRYRWQLIIRSPEPLTLLSRVPMPQGWTVDIDPISLL